MKKYLCLIGVIGLIIYFTSASVSSRSPRFISETNQTEFSKISESISQKTPACNISNIKRRARFFINPEYVLEFFIYKPYSVFKNKKNIIASFSVYSGENYRIVDLSEGFSQPFTFTIFDKNGKNIYSSDKKDKFFDFTAESSGEYTVEWTYKNEDAVDPEKKCVAFAIGFLK